MLHSVRYIKFGRVPEACAIILVGSALPTGWVSIGQKCNEWVTIILYTIIHGSRYWLYNTLWWMSMEQQQILVLCPGWSDHRLVRDWHEGICGRHYRENRLQYPPYPILNMRVNDCWSCILGNQGGDRLQTVINEVFTAFIAKRESVMLPAPSWKWVSTIVGLASWLLTARCGR